MLPSLTRKVIPFFTNFGRRKFVIALFASGFQGAVLTLGVASIFPFLAVASDVSSARDSYWCELLEGFTGRLSDFALIGLVGLIACLALFATNTIILLTNYITARYAYGFGRHLSSVMLRVISSRTYEYFCSNSPGILLKKVNGDANLFVTQVVMSGLQFMTAFFNIFALVILLALVNPVLALGAGVAVGGAYYGLYKVSARSRKEFSEAMLSASRGKSKTLHTFINAIKPIKAHGIENVFFRQFDRLVSRAALAQAKHRFMVGLPRSLIEPIAVSAIVGFLTAYLWFGGDIDNVLPTVGVFAVACYRLLPNIQSAYVAISTISANRHVVDELLDEIGEDRIFPDCSIEDGPSSKVERLRFEREIEFRNVCFEYRNRPGNVLEKVSFSIAKHSSVALVGKTGCGKSTLVDLLLGFHQPSQGRILVDGVELSQDKIRAWQNNIGYVPQDIVLVDDTVVANVAFGIPPEDVDWESLRAACSAAEILELIEEEFPERWDTIVGDRGVRLSGGQRQRIGIARALYRSPRLLILDEATSALDQTTESSVMEAISGLEGRLTMLIVAHRLSTIEWCDQTIDLSQHAVGSDV